MKSGRFDNSHSPTLSLEACVGACVGRVRGRARARKGVESRMGLCGYIYICIYITIYIYLLTFLPSCVSLALRACPMTRPTLLPTHLMDWRAGIWRVRENAGIWLFGLIAHLSGGEDCSLSRPTL